MQGSSSHANTSSSHPDIASSSSPIPHAHAPGPISPPASSCAAAALHDARHSCSSRSTSRARLSRLRRAAAAMSTDDVFRPCEGVGCWSTWRSARVDGPCKQPGHAEQRYSRRDRGWRRILLERATWPNTARAGIAAPLCKEAQQLNAQPDIHVKPPHIRARAHAALERRFQY